jgi:hypothetical protein
MLANLSEEPKQLHSSLLFKIRLGLQYFVSFSVKEETPETLKAPTTLTGIKTKLSILKY